MVGPKTHAPGYFVIKTVVLLLLLTPGLSAENITTVKLELFDSVQRSADGSWLHSGAGSASKDRPDG